MGDTDGEIEALWAASEASEELGAHADVIRYGTDLLRLTGDEAPTGERAILLARLGVSWFAIGDPREAFDHLIQGLELAEEAGDERLVARLSNRLGFVHRDQKNFDQALVLFSRGASIARELGDSRLLASSLNELGNVRSSLGQPEEALQLKEEAFQIATGIGDAELMAFCQNDVGVILAGRGRHEEALRRFEQARDLLQQVGKEREIVISLNNVAEEMVEVGRPEEAAGIAREAASRARAAGLRGPLAGALEVLARAEAASGLFKTAFEALLEAHDLQALQFDESAATRIADLQLRYDFEKQERQIRDLESANEISALHLSRERLLRYAAATVLLMLGVFAVFVYNRYKASLAARGALVAAHAEIQAKNEALEDANRRLAEAALTDALTGLLNRRGLLERIEAEQARACRNQRPFSMVLGDIDGFKSINDSHGHSAGDSVLTGLAQIMDAALRGQDAAARWGGEEFMVLLPETDTEGAMFVAEKMRRCIQDHPFEYRGERIVVTMTFGVCGWDPAMTVDECVRLVDEALYKGKRTGKNCVASAAAVGPCAGSERAG
ncbi:MAG: tetratricopeptide repeat-containing diguanylate cyclase [Pseudomonadota bacterium]